MYEDELRLAELFISGRCAFDFEQTQRVCLALIALNDALSVAKRSVLVAECGGSLYEEK